MVITIPTVNGLAAEILFFLKKLDAKQFAGRILSREMEERRSLRRSDEMPLLVEKGRREIHIPEVNALSDFIQDCLAPAPATLQ